MFALTVSYWLPLHSGAFHLLLPLQDLVYPPLVKHVDVYQEKREHQADPFVTQLIHPDYVLEKVIEDSSIVKMLFIITNRAGHLSLRLYSAKVKRLLPGQIQCIINYFRNRPII